MQLVPAFVSVWMVTPSQKGTKENVKIKMNVSNLELVLKIATI
jgi:hypothetical protein